MFVAKKELRIISVASKLIIWLQISNAFASKIDDGNGAQLMANLIETGNW